MTIVRGSRRRWRSCASKRRASAATPAARLDRELLLEAFRSADFVLNHLAVGEDLGRASWSVAVRRVVNAHDIR